MNRCLKSLLVLVAMLATLVRAGETPPTPESILAQLAAKKAPEYKDLYLKPGDRLAICGDSITEQKMYSRIIETYLTVCAPGIVEEIRQYGWSGEVAEGFLNRMKNDCLRFKPTIATTCYGMNDHRYKAYDEKNGAWYKARSTSVVQAFKAAGARVVVGAPGCVGKMPGWVKTATGTIEDLNHNLMLLRNIAMDIAAQEGQRFADTFGNMYPLQVSTKQKIGPDFCVAGKDGVHPGWSGQVIMAFGYLRALGLDGEIGTFTVDLKGNTAKATDGHTVEGFADGVVSIESKRYPFCGTGPENNDGSIRTGMTLVSFDEHLNRLKLIVSGGTAANYKITWGTESKTFTKEQLEKGVNLAAEFQKNPFSEVFAKVDAAVLAKQAFETKQIKQIFHGAEGKKDMEGSVTKTEAERAPLAAAIKTAFVPVKHTVKIEAQ